MAIVHRDISPQNILVSYEGEVKISDYGISKAASEITLTQAGVVKGKLSYLAPEQALGEPVDHQADIYALGIVFYEILSGKKMHRFTNAMEALRQISEKKIRPIGELRSGIPDELNRIVMKCLEKDKASRYQNAQELLNDLVAFRNSLNMNYDSTMLSGFESYSTDAQHLNTRLGISCRSKSGLLHPQAVMTAPRAVITGIIPKGPRMQKTCYPPRQ